MDRTRVVGVTGDGGPGSGYTVGPRLVLTSAHVVAHEGARVVVFHPGVVDRTFGGIVVWCGTPGGRADAALVLVDEADWDPPVGAAVRWGRLVTSQPGIACETWGMPNLIQHPDAGVDAMQLTGRVNPGTGFVGNRYVMDLLQFPPPWTSKRTSPWGGLSGAPVFCDRLLIGVVASDLDNAHLALNVVPCYVLHHDPRFRAAIAEYGAATPVLEAAEFQYLGDSEAQAPGPLRSPAALLRAERQVVPFHGRAKLLAQLTAWCAQNGFGAWLLHGPGGQGKTRLAHQLTGLLTHDGWAVVWLHAKATPDRIRELREAAKPLLVIVDYAETRADQVNGIVEAAVEHHGSTAFKVLMLARTAGDWWDRARTMTRASEQYLEGAQVEALPLLQPSLADSPEAYRRAVRAFAKNLPHVPGCAGHDWRTLAETLPDLRSDRAGLENALTLHMLALADLLDAAGYTARTVEADDAAHHVEDRLLGHERRYWSQSAVARGLHPSMSWDTLEVALAAAHLAGAPDQDQADSLWRQLPALADQLRDRRNAVTGWVAAVHPPTAPGRPWGDLLPDRLSERFIGRQLDADPGLANHLVLHADTWQLAQLLTVYCRAAAHVVFRGRLDAHLTELCALNYRLMARQIIAVVTQTENPGPLIAALDRILADPAVTTVELRDLAECLPESSQRLAVWAATLARTLVARYRSLPPDLPETLPGLARALNNLSNRLAELGRDVEALAASEEATKLFRELVEAGSEAHLSGYAAALNNLAARQGELLRLEDAIAASTRSIDIHRALLRTDADTEPDVLRADLATALHNHSVWLAQTMDWEASLTASQEATEIFDALAAVAPGVHLHHHAMALFGLALSLGQAGRLEAALAAVQDATEKYRVLADTQPDAHLPNLATALTRYAARLSAVGKTEESLDASKEAIGIYRNLAQIRPEVNLPNLANTLIAFAITQGEIGQAQESLAAIEEAIGFYRMIAKTRPAAHLGRLADALVCYALRLNELGRIEEALAANDEAIDLYRAIAQTDANAQESSLAAHAGEVSAVLRSSLRLVQVTGEVEDSGSMEEDLSELFSDLSAFLSAASEPGRLEEFLGTGEDSADGENDQG